MERSFSVDDIVGGIWRLGAAGMGGRTDSEAAFQEFLKKIPSNSNLVAQAAAAAGGQVTRSWIFAFGRHIISGLTLSGHELAAARFEFAL